MALHGARFTGGGMIRLLGTLTHSLKPVTWFLCCRYGSIGWSVGATLGYALAAARAHPPKRVMAFIGDGSFQVRCCVRMRVALRGITATRRRVCSVRVQWYGYCALHNCC